MYAAVSHVMLQGLSLVYLVAFASLFIQFPPLFGSGFPSSILCLQSSLLPHLPPLLHPP